MKQSNISDSSQRKKRARWLSSSTSAGGNVAKYNNNDSLSPSQSLYPKITPPPNDHNKKLSPTSSSLHTISEREIQAYKEESLRSKSQLKLERVKWEQTESRLRRQIKFLMEESESSRLALEEDRKKNEEELERVTKDRNSILSTLRAAELKIASVHGSHGMDGGGRNSEVLLYQRKNEMLQEKVDLLEDDIQRLNAELTEREERVHELEISMADLKASTPKKEVALSNAPPAVISELNRTRVTLAETQRKLRVQTQKVEGLEKELSTLLPMKEINDLLKSKNTKLEQENASLLKDNLLAKNSKSAWESFYRQLKSAFPDLVPQENFTSPSKLTNSIPPEVSSILRHFKALQSSLSDLEKAYASITQQYNISQENVTNLQSSLATSKTEVQSLQTQVKDYQYQIKTLSITNRKLQSCEAIHKREMDSMQTLLTQTTTDYEKSSIQALQESLSMSKQELETTKSSYQTLEQELSTKHSDYIKLQEEYDTVLHKFGLLKDALMTEREKAAKAEERANQAESLAGKGSYNTNTTRVLHLQSNPLIEALKQKYEAQIENLLAERRDALKDSTDSSFFTSPDGAEKKSVADAQKFNQRLKENFKEQIALFREGVYLLTGLKIDMYNATEQPTFKLRSMYAEREDDYLLFMWPEKYKRGASVTSLDLMHSNYAEEVSKTDNFLYMTNYKSIPSFLASLTLKLFEVQTMA